MELKDSPDSPFAGWTPEQVVAARRWVNLWKETGPELERIRRAELRSTDTVVAMQRLAGWFESAQFLQRPRGQSGLVEQQALFARWKPASNG